MGNPIVPSLISVPPQANIPCSPRHYAILNVNPPSPLLLPPNLTPGKYSQCIPALLFQSTFLPQMDTPIILLIAPAPEPCPTPAGIFTCSPSPCHQNPSHPCVLHLFGVPCACPHAPQHDGVPTVQSPGTLCPPSPMKALSLVFSLTAKTVSPLNMEVFQRQKRARALVHGYPRELASHGAELPCVFARARAYYGWSMWLIDFLYWLEGAVCRPCHLTPGGHRGDSCAMEIWCRDRALGACVWGEGRASLCNVCVSHPCCPGLHAVSTSLCTVRVWTAQHQVGLRFPCTQLRCGGREG